MMVQLCIKKEEDTVYILYTKRMTSNQYIPMIDLNPDVGFY